MIIKSKPLTPFWFKFWGNITVAMSKWMFASIHVEPIELKPDHSYILMTNHTSFWDGIWAFYICRKYFYKDHGMRKLFIMSVKQQMLKKKYLRYLGSFSIEPGRRSITESFDYAGEVLSTPGNLLLYYPQGELESCYVRHIVFDQGLNEIIPRIKGNCQLIWVSGFAECFESLQTSLYSYMLDCGTNHDYNYEDLKAKVNKHHKNSMFKQVRFTVEPDGANKIID